ncbi:Protein of unknown function [Tenacibaculum sp. MAR_2010_89]|uniref:DUF4255 domain-containing protein n=1 Tax=Tenacibaculum sp. MAR_2010_89 TaxID=1250198 RepID=UPI00089BF4DD|nr:DUF4255 domain-containing protein [Tenacibaculum sp. MAR_2010_89]SEE65312.1 Protein of unknown function [Tenacibaculum sp. MAR_2010_89]
MILKALQFTNRTLNQFLKNKFGLSDDVVVTNKIIDQNGTDPIENQNKVIITLIHVEQETVKSFYRKNKQLNDGNYENKPLDERYNLYLLVAPNFEQYNETLKFLNATIQFFQINGVLDANTSSKIPKGISRLEFEFEKGDGYLQMHNLWSALGAKYQPSVIYKMRLVTIVSDEINAFESSVNVTSNRTIDD